MTEKYYGSITAFPDGSIYAGEHEEAIPTNGPLLAVIKKHPAQKGLSANSGPFVGIASSCSPA